MERKSFKLINSEGLLENTNISNENGEFDSPEVITVDYLRKQIIQLLSDKEGCFVAREEISESLQIDSGDESEVELLRITLLHLVRIGEIEETGRYDYTRKENPKTLKDSLNQTQEMTKSSLLKPSAKMKAVCDRIIHILETRCEYINANKPMSRAGILWTINNNYPGGQKPKTNSTVDASLLFLVESGRIIKAGHGLYALPGSELTEQQSPETALSAVDSSSRKELDNSQPLACEAQPETTGSKPQEMADNSTDARLDRIKANILKNGLEDIWLGLGEPERLIAIMHYGLDNGHKRANKQISRLLFPGKPWGEDKVNGCIAAIEKKLLDNTLARPITRRNLLLENT